MGRLIKQLFSSQLRLNMLSGSVLTIINLAIGLISYPIYIYYLNVDVYAVWLLLALVLTFSRIGMLGMPLALQKLIAEEYNSNSNSNSNSIKKIEQYITTSICIMLIVGLLISVTILLFNNSIVDFIGIKNEEKIIASNYLPYIAILSAYVFIAESIKSTLSGLGRMDKANYLTAVSGIITSFTSIILLFFEFGILSLIAGNFLSLIFIHLSSIYYIKKIENINIFTITRYNNDKLLSLIRFGGGISLISFMTMMISPFNKIILARYVSLESVVVFEIAFRVSQQFRSIFNTIFNALLPEISKINSQGGDTNKLNSIRRKSYVIIFFIGLPLYLSIFISANFVLKLWLGDSFIVEMPDILRILLISSFGVLIAMPAYFMLIGRGHIRHTLISSAIQSSINIISIIGILLFGYSLNIYIVSIATSLGLLIGSMYLIIKENKCQLNPINLQTKYLT